jgi:nucleotidyltransferase/DNA polymerase involved in DNA repair
VTHWVLHVDMDQFIAAVELLRRSELRGRPVVVGGDGDPTKRGVVSTASYEAREYGLHSGMPLRTAARRCPEAVFLAVDRELYEAASAKVMATLQELVVEVLGWDEAFIAVETDGPEATAREIQQRVRAATDLNCSVGIGQNKLQAKMATGFGKPAGIFRLTNESWFALLGERPTDALWGIGSKTAKRLSGMGISTVLELSQTDPHTLAAAVGPTTGPWLVHLAQGRGSSTVVSAEYIARSHSRETTFQQDLEDWGQVCREVAVLAGASVRRCRRRATPCRPRSGEGALRAVHHPHPWPGANSAILGCGGYRAGRPGCAGSVHLTRAGAVAGCSGRAGDLSLFGPYVRWPAGVPLRRGLQLLGCCEVAQQLRETLGIVKVWKVTRTLEQLKPAAGDGLKGGGRVPGRDHPILRAPDNQRGDRDGGQEVILRVHSLSAGVDDGASRGEEGVSTVSIGKGGEPAPGFGHVGAGFPAHP